MKKNLFKEVKSFINNVEIGSTYKVKDLVYRTRGIESVTRWKTQNDPAYRTRTYQSYLRCIGVISHVKYGVWRVEKPIPEEFNLGHTEFLCGFHSYNCERGHPDKNPTYNGMTKNDVWNLLNSPVEIKDTPTNDEINRKMDELRLEHVLDDSNPMLDGSEPTINLPGFFTQYLDPDFTFTYVESKPISQYPHTIKFTEGKQRVIDKLVELEARFRQDSFEDIAHLTIESQPNDAEEIIKLCWLISQRKEFVEKWVDKIKDMKYLEDILGLSVLVELGNPFLEDAETLLNVFLGVEITITY